MQRIEDEKGRKWVVFEGDPAYQAVKKLEKKGYRWVVLPTDYFVGEPTEYDVDGCFYDGQHDLEMSEQFEDKDMSAEYYASGMRYIQLAECMTACV